MPELTDLWYLRLPDGRIVKADTAALRQQIASGRLTNEVQIRRHSGEAWKPLEALDEFVSNKRAESVASRLDPVLLKFAGVRPMLEEMAAALDSLLTGRKLRVTFFAGLIHGVLLTLVAYDLPWPWLWIGLSAVVGLAQMALLTRMSFHELSRMRPARLVDGLTGLFGHVLTLLPLLGPLVSGLIASRYAVPLLLPHIPVDWSGPALLDGLALGITITLGYLLLHGLPLFAVVAVEESGPLGALSIWRGVAQKQHLSLFASQWLILAIGLALAAPIGVMTWASVHPVWAMIVRGMMVSVVLSYIAVANVFLYLHFRYTER